MTTYIKELPLYLSPDYQYSAPVEGINRLFRFYWNNRQKAWHMDITHDDGTVVVKGVRLVPQHPLLADYALSEVGMTGYFLLAPLTLNSVGAANDQYEDIPTKYGLLYIYVVE